MRRYLDILRSMEALEGSPKTCGQGSSNAGGTNEKNEKSGVPTHPEMQVRRNQVRTGRIVLVTDGWVVVRENVCGERLVFVRVGGNVQIVRD
jgi:hypothetical protein